jgi:hypothetical protein
MERPNIEAVKDRLRAATPGPWHRVRGQAARITPYQVNHPGELCKNGSAEMSAADMELVAAAPTDLASLLSYIEALEAERQVTREIMAEIARGAPRALAAAVAKR